jgi:outer membrane protein assembly factor BamE (lipoprotein component of BamABCDE complex)
MKKSLLIVMLAIACVTAGCQGKEEQGKSPLSYGNVKRTIVEGETTQAEILQAFGSPNLVTRNSYDDEVWSYNKMSADKGQSSSYGSVFLFGGSSATSSSSTKSFDLIITFDEYDVVRKYKVIQAAY